MRLETCCSLLVSLYLVGCASQEFAGDAGAAGVRKQEKPVPPLVPPVLVEIDDLKTDDGGRIGEIPGLPVERVGVGFEDWTDMDFNDIYVCFQGHFNVNGRDIVSNRDQTVQATWGNISANNHFMTIKIIDAAGKETFNQGYQGTRKTSPIGTIPLTFSRGSKLQVMIAHNSTQHTNPNMAVVHLNQCNNTGR
jgi:hypothetical protein